MALRVTKLLLLVVVFTTAPLIAADPEAMEAKLREALKNTMLQLRDAQGQVAVLQATQAENEAKITELTAQVETLTKQVIAGEKSIAELTQKSTAQDLEITRLKESLEKWKQGYNQAAALARDKEGARAKLANDVILMQRKIDDQQRKNDAMFKLGNEILDRYKRFGLGDALAAKEPFIGTTRIKFQNSIQTQEDKLIENKIRYENPSPSTKPDPNHPAGSSRSGN